jgi:hypothetical protein
VGNTPGDWFSCLLADPNGTATPSTSYTDKGVYTEDGLKSKKCVGVSGRYIKLTQPAVGCMNLAEIQVFTPDGTNIANTAKVTKSSEYQGDKFPVQNFVDGNLNNFVHTSCEDAGTITLDFGKLVNISKIVLFNRRDCCGRRSNGIILTIADDYENTIYKANPLADQFGSTVFKNESYPSYRMYTFLPPDFRWIASSSIFSY